MTLTTLSVSQLHDEDMIANKVETLASRGPQTDKGVEN